MKLSVLIFALLFSIPTFSKTVKTKTPPGCDFFFQKENLCGTLRWMKPAVVVAAPTAKDAAAFDLNLWDAKTGSTKGPFLNLAPEKSLIISLHMPDMGHGSEPVILKKDEKEVGLYHISQVLFSMEGAWEIRGRIQKGGKTIDTATLPFNFK